MGGSITNRIASRAQSLMRSSGRTAAKYSRTSSSDAGMLSGGAPSSEPIVTPSSM